MSSMLFPLAFIFTSSTFAKVHPRFCPPSRSPLLRFFSPRSSQLRSPPPSIFASSSISSSISSSPESVASHPMGKVILLTGSSDGIGLETALLLADPENFPDSPNTLLLHGRSPAKLDAAVAAVRSRNPAVIVDHFLADLSDMSAVRQLASTVLAKHPTIDVLINNAGVLKLPPTARVTPDGLDARFAVNTIAPYLLTSLLMPALRAGKGKSKARVVNVSSAAQRSVSLKALSGASLPKDDMAAYAMSKLGITMWTKHMADEEGSRQGQHDGEKKIVFVAVNPGSLLNTKMVREGFGFTNGGADVGAKVLVRAATSDEFANANGEYFDNDARRFAPLHHDAADTTLNAALVNKMEQVLKRLGGAAS